MLFFRVLPFPGSAGGTGHFDSGKGFSANPDIVFILIVRLLDAAAHPDLAFCHAEGQPGAGLQAGPGKPGQLHCGFKAEYADVAFDLLSGATASGRRIAKSYFSAVRIRPVEISFDLPSAKAKLDSLLKARSISRFFRSNLPATDVP